MHHLQRSARRGHGLVSTLAPLSITALGVSLALPLLGARQQDAAQARSMRNLQALTNATRAYMEDWDGTFPGWKQNPNGSYSHNVWDQLIFPYVRHDNVYSNGLPNGIRSWADPNKRRVLSYGMNGLLICSPPDFTGSCRAWMISNEAIRIPPIPISVADVTHPQDTILFAELSTQDAVSGYFIVWNKPYLPYSPRLGRPPSPAWVAALDHWIDISPREWVENATPTLDSYEPATWNPNSGVARDLYGGGGNYAFVDGHVQFMSVGETVGLWQTVYPRASSPYRITPGSMAWRVPDNYLNKWSPKRAFAPPDYQM